MGSEHTEAAGQANNRNLALDTAPPSPGGPVDVKKTQADLAKLRWFIWAHCAFNALKDDKFIRYYYAYGLRRLKLIRDLEHKFGSEQVRLSRLLKTQFAQALVLDWHINLPGGAINGWANAAVGVDGMAFNHSIEWSTFDAAREYKIIKRLVEARRVASMTDGAQRGAFVAACLSGLSYPAKGRAYDQATYEAWATANDAFLTRIGYQHGALQLLWEMNHDNHGFLEHERPAD